MILAVVAITYYAFNQGLPFVHQFTLNAIVTQQRQRPWRRSRSGSPESTSGRSRA